jgi:hypothetical protein
MAVFPAPARLLGVMTAESPAESLKTRRPKNPPERALHQTSLGLG